MSAVISVETGGNRVRTVSRVLAGVCLASAAAPALAQYSATGTVNASANVVRTLSVTSTTDLSFGTFAPGPTGGTVVMSAIGNRTATGGVTLVNTTPGSQATVNLAGTPSTAYSLTLPSSVLLTASTGGATMTLSSFTTTLTAGQGSLNSGGTGSFGIGGTLSVSANQPIAVYTGSVTVTLTYN
ncbi:MAG: DUF4402 domain-containing protein [Rubrivivax sp.]|jgi:hypothetical protein